MFSPDRLASRETREEQYDSLSLKREEIPVIEGDYPFTRFGFFVPVHDLVLGLPEEIKSDGQRAEEIYDQVWAMTVEDIEGLIAGPENIVNKDEAEGLGSLISQGREHWRQRLSFRLSSQDLLLAKLDHALVFLDSRRASWIHSPNLNGFSPGKMKAYAGTAINTCPDRVLFCPRALFKTHGSDNLFQGHFLRNWCLEYHNNLLKNALGLETPEPTPVL